MVVVEVVAVEDMLARSMRFDAGRNERENRGRSIARGRSGPAGEVRRLRSACYVNCFSGAAARSCDTSLVTSGLSRALHDYLL